MGSAFFRGPYAYGKSELPPPEPAGVLSAQVRYVDGAAQVADPAYLYLQVDTVVGGLAEAGPSSDCFIVNSNSALMTVQASAYVQHTYGRYVIFGFQVDNEPIVELGRVQVNSEELIYVWTRRTLPVRDGKQIKLVVSSDFEWEDFSWENAEILLFDYVA